MDEKIKKLIELKNLFTSDTASKGEFSTAMNAVLKAVKQFGINVGNELIEQKKSFAKQVKELKDWTDSVQNEMSLFVGRKQREFSQEVSEGIAEVRSLIPTEDFSDLAARVSELENEEDEPDMTAVEAMVLVNTEDAPLIKADRVEGLEERFKKIEEKAGKQMHIQGTTGRDFVYSQDIGSRFDGVTKTFPISGVYIILAVMLDSYPYGSLVEGLHYTYTPQSITFTSEIFEASQLATGQRCKIIAIKP